jgi:hypothetical protein
MAPIKNILEIFNVVGSISRSLNNLAMAAEAQSEVILKDSQFDVEQKNHDLEDRRAAFKLKLAAAPA